jgi:mannose-6-phosphate isomerase-like protein (cupin superfamily)
MSVSEYVNFSENIMRSKPVYVTYEDEVPALRIARQGSSASLIIKKLMDPEDTGSISGTVLVAEARAHHEPITPHAHQEVEESLYVVTGNGHVAIGPTIDDMQTFPLRPGACIYVPANYFHIITVENEDLMKLVISYFPTDKPGRSHREIAVDLTNVPLQKEYGK